MIIEEITLYDSHAEGVTTAEYEEDGWYEENEIPREIVEANEGRSFCSSACEYRFLMAD